MPVYRIESAGRSLFEALLNYLASIAKGADVTLHILDFTRPENDNPLATYGPQRIWQKDQLLVREGKPLLAVAIGYTPALEKIEGYEDAPAYAGSGTPVKDANLADMTVDLLKRVKNELTPTKEDKKPEPVLIEASWSVTIRGPGIARKTWTGSPFDVDTLTAAFNAVVDAIVLRAKPTESAPK